VLDSIDDAKTMAKTSPLEDLSARIRDFLAASPAKDLEKNLRALLTAAFAKLDLATRQEFEVQAQALSRAREKLAELEQRVVELEARLRQK
jgi:ubiquinone biosynthesis accessory factor UbiK